MIRFKDVEVGRKYLDEEGLLCIKLPDNTAYWWDELLEEWTHEPDINDPDEIVTLVDTCNSCKHYEENICMKLLTPVTLNKYICGNPIREDPETFKCSEFTLSKE